MNKAFVLLIFPFAIGTVVASSELSFAQNEEAFVREADGVIERLPSTWEHEVKAAIAVTWSDQTAACLREVKVVVSESQDPLAVSYTDGEIVLSRAYAELAMQGTLFTFMTILGVFPEDDLPDILDRYEMVLEARRSNYLSFRRGESDRPKVFLDDSYARPYQERLVEAFSGFGQAQTLHVADILNGAPLFFALLHEAGHHVFRNCIQTADIDPTLNEEVWADEFAFQVFAKGKFPDLLAIEAVRILYAYKASDSSSGEASLKCRLALLVSQLETPEPRIFKKSGLSSPDSEMFSSNLGRLTRVYKERYSLSGC